MDISIYDDIEFYDVFSEKRTVIFTEGIKRKEEKWMDVAWEGHVNVLIMEHEDGNIYGMIVGRGANNEYLKNNENPFTSPDKLLKLWQSGLWTPAMP